jgi:hypothetical protein
VKVKEPDSTERKMFKVLKRIGMELSSYHGGTLNGKDIKKVMNNSTYIFHQLAWIFQEGKSLLSNNKIATLCLHFREVFVLWDGIFLLARTINSDEADISTYRMYKTAAMQGYTDLKCAITPKVHLMLKHVEWQMKYIRGGLEDKMEDWVERMHQDGMHEQQRFWTLKNPEIRTKAREKVHVRGTHADVVAFTKATNEGNKRNLSERKVDTILVTQKRQGNVGQNNGIIYFEQMKGKGLTWLSVLFNDAKGEGMDGKGNDSKIAQVES